MSMRPAIAPELLRGEARAILSEQTRLHIEIGLEVAEMAREEIEGGKAPQEALTGLINNCLRRDEGWKLSLIHI